MSDKPIYPVQCGCGHIYLERYEFPEPTERGVAGFCWCGFCRTRHNVMAAIGEKPQTGADKSQNGTT